MAYAVKFIGPKFPFCSWWNRSGGGFWVGGQRERGGRGGGGGRTNAIAVAPWVTDGLGVQLQRLLKESRGVSRVIRLGQRNTTQTAQKVFICCRLNRKT